MNHALKRNSQHAHRRLRVGLFMAALVLTLPVFAERPKIGLALSGGGARGAAHIGVLRVLEEQRIPIDCIAGTSMGAIIGGLYATGHGVDALERIITETDWEDALNDETPRQDRSFRRKRDDDTYLIKNKPGVSDDFALQFPSGLIQGQKVDLLLERLTLPVASITDFDEFRIPYRAVAADIATGEEVVIGTGSLATAIRASMSIPGGFAPVRLDGRMLVDGGVANNLPVSVVRDLCADIVIAVDISTPLAKPEELNSVFSIASQLTAFLTRRNTERQIASLDPDDVLIVPDLSGIDTLDFSVAIDAVPRGRDATQSLVNKLRPWSLDEAAYAAYRAQRPEGIAQRQEPVVAFVRFVNDSDLSTEVIESYVSHGKQALIGRPIDLDRIEKEISRLYGLELFESITYDVVEENGQHGIEVQLRERSWGPNYLQGGVDWANDPDGDGLFNLGLLYKRTLINPLNGELRVALQIGDEPGLAAEIYQPLDPGQRWFIDARGFLSNRNARLFSGNDELANFRISSFGIEAGAGYNIGDWGRLRLGLGRASGDIELRIGEPLLYPDRDYDLALLSASFQVDTLDNLAFPREGVLGGLEWIGSRESLGSDSDYDQLKAGVGTSYSWGRNTLSPFAYYYTTLDDEGALESFFRAGGFMDLSGFQTNQLIGQHYGLLGLAYWRRLTDFNLFRAHAGFSVESGNVWQVENDVFDDMLLAGSVFIGAETPLGPLYLAFGAAEGNNQTFYLSLGSPVLIVPR
jgi:NTE family protein